LHKVDSVTIHPNTSGETQSASKRREFAEENWEGKWEGVGKTKKSRPGTGANDEDQLYIIAGDKYD